MDALSRNPCGPAPTEGIGELEIQVASVIKVVLNVMLTIYQFYYIELEPSSSDVNC